MREVIEDDEGSSSESSLGLGAGRSDPELELLFPGEKIGVRKERKGKRRSEREGLLRQGELPHSDSSFLAGTDVRMIWVQSFDDDGKR